MSTISQQQWTQEQREKFDALKKKNLMRRSFISEQMNRITMIQKRQNNTYSPDPQDFS